VAYSLTKDDISHPADTYLYSKSRVVSQKSAVRMEAEKSWLLEASIKQQLVKI
jgi:hypothetical protein